MNNKKDVLFLCQYFYPEYVSSATLPFDTAVRLAEEGFSVSAICGYPKEYSKSKEVPIEETFKKIEIKRLKYIQLKRSSFLGRLINYFSFTFSVVINFRDLKKFKSIIVYSNPPVLPFIAGLASKFFNTKIIFVSFDVYPEIAYKTNVIAKDSLLTKLMILVNKTIFNNVNKVVALSNEMKNYLLEHRWQLNENQIEVIPNWFEDKGVADKYKSQKNELFRSIFDGRKLIVSYFGNLGIAQDFNTLIDAMRELKYDSEVLFVFAGHGNKMDILKEIIKQEGLNNVKVYNFLHGQDFEDALNISDCFIVSLAKGLTGLAVPSKTYSYMMAGKPVIAIMDEGSDIAKDLIQNKAGYAVQGGESSKLVSAIYELKNDKNKLKIMGENCRNVYLRKYTKENCTGQYVSLIKKVLEE
jgi:glycosyltransferase involved in cell wall biosynthesis